MGRRRPTAGVIGRLAVLALAVTMLVTAGPAPIGPPISAGVDGIGGAAVVDGRAVRLAPPAARELPAYPTGSCDRTSGGVALAPGQVPDHYGVVGRSVEGRPIWVEHWGAIEGPQVLVVAGVHGNECSPDVLVQTIRQHPPASYGIWLVPLLNPDGRVLNTRENARRVDLNGDGHLRSQPETQALMEMTAQLRPVLTVHVHSPNGFVGWFGTGRYVIADPITSVAPLSHAIAVQLSRTSELRLDGAGYRYGSDAFLWQGQFAVWPQQEALLVELFAIGHLEVPNATPRPATRRPDQITDISHRLLAALETVLVPDT